MPFQLQMIYSTEWLDNSHRTSRERQSGSCGGLVTYSPDRIKKTNMTASSPTNIQHEQFPNTHVMFT